MFRLRYPQGGSRIKENALRRGVQVRVLAHLQLHLFSLALVVHQHAAVFEMPALDPILGALKQSFVAI